MTIRSTDDELEYFDVTAETILSSIEAIEEDCDDGSLLDQPNVRYPIITAYAFTFLLCILGNSFTIIVIIVHRSMRTSTNFFLANLAFADLLVSVFCILQNMFHVVGSDNGHWDFGEFLCKSYILILHLVPCTGVGILVCVSVEKYIAVLHPLVALKILTNKLRVVLMTAVWGISIICNAPYYFTAVEMRYNQLAACTRKMDGFGPIQVSDVITISFFMWYCIPLIIMAYLYTRIGMVLWTSGLEPVSIRYSNEGTNNSMTNGAPTILLTIPNDSAEKSNNFMGTDRSATVTITEDENAEDSVRLHDDGTITESVHTDIFESRKKIIRLLIAIVCSFAILTLPHHARLLYMVYAEQQMCNSTWTALLQPFTYLCMFLSSSINPILYAFMSQRFRSAVQDIIKCRVCEEAQRKHMRTRTFVSDIPISRTPSLTYLSSSNHQYYLTVSDGAINAGLLPAADPLHEGAKLRNYSHNNMPRFGSNLQNRRQISGSVNNIFSVFRHTNSDSMNTSLSANVSANFHKFTRQTGNNTSNNNVSKNSNNKSLMENNKINSSYIKSNTLAVPKLRIIVNNLLIDDTETGGVYHRQMSDRNKKLSLQYRRRSQSQADNTLQSPARLRAATYRNSDSGA